MAMETGCLVRSNGVADCATANVLVAAFAVLPGLPANSRCKADSGHTGGEMISASTTGLKCGHCPSLAIVCAGRQRHPSGKPCARARIERQHGRGGRKCKPYDDRLTQEVSP